MICFYVYVMNVFDNDVIVILVFVVFIWVMFFFEFWKCWEVFLVFEWYILDFEEEEELFCLEYVKSLMEEERNFFKLDLEIGKIVYRVFKMK